MKKLIIITAVCILAVTAFFTLAQGRILMGDVNYDGKVNTADATLLLKKSSGMITFTDEQTAAGDANLNGFINTADATYVLKVSAGMAVALYSGEDEPAETPAPTGEPAETPAPTGEPAETPAPTSEPVSNVFITYFDSLNEQKVGEQTIPGAITEVTADILTVPEGYKLEKYNLSVPAAEMVTVNVYPYELIDGYDYKLIRTVEGMRNIDNDLWGNYLLDADIDFRGKIFKPIGWEGESYNSPQKPFKGTFDGRGHILNDLYIDYCGSSKETRFSNVALFAQNDGMIKNVILYTNVPADSTVVYYGIFGDCNVGALVGTNNGTISSCRIYGYVGSLDRFMLKTGGGGGGICGTNYGTVEYSSYEGWLDGCYNIGGITGKHYGVMHECYFAGSINATTSNETLHTYEISFIGGICGYTKNAEIIDCYAYCTGELAGYQGIGGMCGSYDGGIIRNCWAANMMIYYTLDAGYAVGYLPNGEASYPSEQSGLFYYTDYEYELPEGYSPDVWNLDNVALLQLPDLNRCPRNASFFSIV